MSSVEHIDVYYPPDQQTESNRVGEIDITDEVYTTTIHKTFLGEPFGRDVVLAGSLLRERRKEWATRRAHGKILFQAEAVLGNEIAGQLPADPGLVL